MNSHIFCVEIYIFSMVLSCEVRTVLDTVLVRVRYTYDRYRVHTFFFLLFLAIWHTYWYTIGTRTQKKLIIFPSVKLIPGF